MAQEGLVHMMVFFLAFLMSSLEYSSMFDGAEQHEILIHSALLVRNHFGFIEPFQS